jgi:Domain of unknown function (DUF4037)
VPFVPGIELNRRFYSDVVAPLLGPLRHSAGLLGWGSDVLGYDDARSADHGWGPRLVVFVVAADVARAQAMLDDGLPDEFDSLPVRYGWDDTPVQHHVTVTELGRWLEGRLGHDPRDSIFTGRLSAPMTALDWLLIPQQQLLGVVRGALYHDGLGEVEPLRARLQWFPDDVWQWMLACQWRRIEQEEAFVGRAAEVGDDLGSRLVAARLCRELMRLHFLLARRYWPYTKWFGTAYRELAGSTDLLPLFAAATQGVDIESREAALVCAYEKVAQLHNEARITAAVDPTVRNFHARPFQVLHAERFVDACLAVVRDEWLLGLPLVGSIDQFVDSTDVLAYADRARRLRDLYRAATT